MTRAYLSEQKRLKPVRRVNACAPTPIRMLSTMCRRPDRWAAEVWAGSNEPCRIREHRELCRPGPSGLGYSVSLSLRDAVGRWWPFSVRVMTARARSAVVTRVLAEWTNAAGAPSIRSPAS